MSAPAMLWTYLFLLVALRCLLSFPHSMWAWGLNVQRFLDPATGWGLWAIAALTLIPPAARPLAGAAGSMSKWFESRTGSLKAFFLGALLVSVMPDRTWFVGDFLLRQSNVEAHFYPGIYLGALPLDRFLHQTLQWPLGAGSDVAANTAARALGAIEAGLLAIFALRFAGALAVEGALAALAAGVVFFGGYLTMFTGLGKPASELCLVVVAFATFGIAALEQDASLVPFGLTMAIAFALHRSSVILIPTALLVGWRWFALHGRAEWRRPGTWLAVLAPALLAILMAPRIAAVASYDWSHHLLTPEARQQGGVLVAAFAPRHLLELLNLVLALSPLAVGAPLLLAARRRHVARSPRGLVLGTLALSYLAAALVIHPQHGIFRDWDVFAPVGMAFSLTVAWLMVEVIGAESARRWLVAPSLALVMVSSLQWLVVNRQTDCGLARVRAYLTEPPGPSGPSAADRPLIWDFIATRALRMGLWDQAADAAAHAALDLPHRRIFLMRQIAETMRGNDRAAEQASLELLRLDANDPLGWLGLAGAAKRLDDSTQFARALTKLRSYPADGEEMRVIRRHLAYYPQIWPDSLVWK